MRHRPTLAYLVAVLMLGSLLSAAAVAQDVPKPPPLEPDAGQVPAEPVDPDMRAPGERVDTQPKSPQDHDAMLAELYAHLAQAHDAAEAAPIAGTIERLWGFTDSPTIGVLMNRAFKAVREDRNELALKLLDAVVELSPDYAEGWSRRAYVHYLVNDYDRAVGDLRRALALEPNHFKALDGLARILRESGQKKSALKVYEQILRIHPYMPGAKEATDELRVEVEGQGI